MKTRTEKYKEYREMPIKDMSKEKLEDFIKEEIERIMRVVKIHNPEGTYLTMTYQDGSISFNNRYWDEDKKFPIMKVYLKDEDE